MASASIKDAFKCDCWMAGCKPGMPPPRNVSVCARDGTRHENSVWLFVVLACEARSNAFNQPTNLPVEFSCCARHKSTRFWIPASKESDDMTNCFAHNLYSSIFFITFLLRKIYCYTLFWAFRVMRNIKYKYSASQVATSFVRRQFNRSTAISAALPLQIKCPRHSYSNWHWSIIIHIFFALTFYLQRHSAQHDYDPIGYKLAYRSALCLTFNCKIKVKTKQMNADYNRHKDNRNKIMLIFHPNNSPTLCLGASRPLSRRAFGMANAANGIFDSVGSIGND